MAIAICPGSFDPATMGHVDIITRASQLFDKVFVAVMKNPSKHPAFSVDERVELLKKCVGNIKNVEIFGFDGLLAEAAINCGATVIIKGLRAISDFEYEFQMALANKKLAPEIETVFLTTNSQNMFVSSSVVKQIGEFGGDISGLVPENIHDDIIKRLYRKEA